MSTMNPQLFYTITDPGGAAARRFVMAHDLKASVDFRNVHYDEVRADLTAHHAQSGGTGEPTLPALWDGTRLHQGEAAVLAALAALAAAGPKAP